MNSEPVREEEPYYTVEYRMQFDDGTVTSYAIDIHKETMISNVMTDDVPPEWARLENGKCTNCPLENSEYCPIALRLAEPLRRFDGLISQAQAMTTVTTPERNYIKKGDLQDSLRSLIGLVMATSGCPLMQPFKYMARYHLPFSSLEETICRITSTYLMRQLTANIDKKELSIDLQEIERLYNTMRSLNEAMATRLRNAVKWSGDGTVSAIVILNTFSSLIPIIIRDEIKNLQPLFK